MPSPPTFREECRATILLALPLISGQLSQMLMGVADTVMAGRLGVMSLGAATFANTLLVVPLVFGMGLLTAVSVRVSQAHGAGQPAGADAALRYGTLLALGYGVLVVAGVLLALPLLGRLGQPPEIVERARPFLLICTVSLVPALLAMTAKNFADALQHPWPAFWITLGGVGLNIGLNWLWIWGHWGFPALGLAGAGWGTLAARTVTAAALYGCVLWGPQFRAWVPGRWGGPIRGGALRHLLLIGWPTSLQLLTEVGAFAAASLIIGTMGAIPLAAHQVAITCAATTFMVPLGISMAITVRVGSLAGAGAGNRLRRVLCGGWLFAVGFMLLSTLVFLIGGRWIAGCFVNDPLVIAIAGRLLIVAGFFQLFDGVQIVASGALRGVDDVRFPARVAAVAYWLIALPGGLALGPWFGGGPLGVWIGLAAGLAFAAAALSWRAWNKLGQA